MKYNLNYNNDRIKLMTKHYYFTYTNVYLILILVFSLTSTISFIYLSITLSNVYSKINIDALDELNITMINEIYETLMVIKREDLISCLAKKCHESSHNDYDPITST